MNLDRYLQIKKATVTRDFMLGLPANILVSGTGLGPIVDLATEVTGANKNITKDDIKKMEESYLAVLPGVHRYRLGSKSRFTEKELGEDKKNNALHNAISNVSTEVVPSVAGGVIGYNKFKQDIKGKRMDPAKLKSMKNKYIRIGAIMGMLPGLAGNVVGGTYGLIKDPGKKELIEHYEDKNSILKSYLIPGYGTFWQGQAAKYSDKYGN